MGDKRIIQYFHWQEEFFRTRYLVDEIYLYCHTQIQRWYQKGLKDRGSQGMQSILWSYSSLLA